MLEVAGMNLALDRKEVPVEPELYGAIGAALGSLLAGGSAYLKARNDKVAKADTSVALAQSELAHYITTELRVCHEQQADLRRDVEEWVAQRDREREEHRAELAEVRRRLDACENNWRHHDTE